MASKKNQTKAQSTNWTNKLDRKNSVRSQFNAAEQGLFDLLVAHYVRGEAQRKNIIGDFHRTGMDPARAKAVAMAAVQYLAESRKRPNDGRYPRQICLYACAMGGDVVHVFRPHSAQSVPLPGDPLPIGAWEIVAIEVLEDCPDTQRGTHG